MDWIERKSATQHVPHVGHDCTAGDNYPNHFADALRGVRNEHKDKCHYSSIEAAVGERKGHGIALLTPCQARRRSGACKRELPFGWIDPLDLRGATSRGQ